ncbi:MAG: Ppx/GppA family phosphatase [Bdellovibrionales bacterium]|nr:Ppx/GppA family phosphatase [Bdellovibrionales bacterium]
MRMRVAALDLGSNTSLLLIAEMDGSHLVRVLHDETNVTKMGQGVHANRRFHPEALQRLDCCFADYARTIAEFKCDKIVAVATSAARDVSNGQELILLGKKHGIPIHIISGDKEAQLTFRGALCDRMSTAGIAVIDVGGGSTEIISEQNGVPKGTSVDVGSVRLTELFVHSHPISSAEMQAVQEYSDEAFAQAPLPKNPIHEVVAVAGTPTTLAAVDQKLDFSEDAVHGYKLSLSTIEAWTEKLAAMTVAQREALPGMQPKRADVIVTGALILAGAIRALGKTEATVSTRGVRYGVALAWQEF